MKDVSKLLVMKITATKRKLLLTALGAFILLLTLIFTAYQLGFVNDVDVHLGTNAKIVYGPVLTDRSGGNYTLLWITDEPTKSSIHYGVGSAAEDTYTKYHYYKIDADKLANGSVIKLKHGPSNAEEITFQGKDTMAVQPDLPFTGYGKVTGLPEGEGFVVVEVDNMTFISPVIEGRWSIDFPSNVQKGWPARVAVIKDKVIYQTEIDLSLVQPAPTIVLEKTGDRIASSNTRGEESFIESLVSDVLACEGDVGDWTINCPSGETHTETDKCTQQRFMDTHGNGYDQWAYEACGCPLEGDAWTAECNDGTTFEEADMCSHDLFYRVHGSNGYSQWQTEACQDHGGPLELREEQEGAWNRQPFEKTPPTVQNQQTNTSAPQPEITDPYICCWGENGGSYAGPTDVNNQCIGGTYMIGTAQTSDSCESQFNQPEDEIRKIIEEEKNKPDTPPQTAENPYDPALAGDDLRSYNSNYPSKEDSLSRICGNFPESVLYWSQNIVYWADTYNLDPNMLAAVMSVESCGNPTALSGSGAQSLYQVMPFHFESGEDAWDPDTNARAAARFLASGLERMGGDVGLAFAGYNGGYWGPVKDGYANKANWPSETQRYYDLTMGLWNDSQNCGNTTVGTDNFMKNRRYSCDAAMDILNSGSQAQGTSSIASMCFEPDKRGRCSTADCDDKIGESCTTDPDTCVFGGICISGKCEYFERSGCSYPDGENKQAANTPTAPPASNDKPVRVAKRGDTGTYPVIEYNEQKGSSYSQYPTRFPHEYVVLHWTAGGESQTAESVVGAFRNMSTGTNYTVDRDGEIHYQYPVGQTLFNARDEYINSSSISFENVGTGGTSWSTLNYDQAMADVQRIKYHIDNGDTVSVSQLKVIGHFEVKNAAGNSDPGKEFMTWVCSKLHEDGYMVKCNWGVDSAYHINDSRVAFEDSSTVGDLALINRVDAQAAGYTGPGMYRIEFDGYELYNTSVYLQKDITDTTFFEDRNGNDVYDLSEDIDLTDRILSVEKISNEVAINLEDHVNMKSFPALPDGVNSASTLADYINSMAGDVQSISRMNNGEWQTFVMRDGLKFSEDFEISANEPLYIKLLYKTTIIVEAPEDLRSSADTLLNGWNPVVVNSSGGQINASEIARLFDTDGQVDAVFQWDGGKYIGITFDSDGLFGNDFVLRDGEPYWIRIE